ncbi:hypothetical protein ACFQPF_05310 [Fictibacillus iocasae]|uniref:Imm33-like domain-containing protein n=1 Tax=Fictibacillus iocasae TaxID=2715437 RepID=A0ABW2NK82_9BACL
MSKIIEQQKQLCQRFNAHFYPAEDHLKLGISRQVKEGLQPVLGLRLPPEEGTTGWFI